LIPGGEPGRLNDPIDPGLAAGVATPSTPAVAGAVGSEPAERDGGAEGVEDEARGNAVARLEGATVRAGGGVAAGHVPAGDAGGRAAPVCESKRKPTSSPAATFSVDAPRSELTQAPPECETNRTQYEPEAVKQPGG
jgi:hypothetical protein